MFIDEAKIYVKGGDGGNGIVAFRREKYVPLGGPYGGNGGNGASVIFVTDEGLRTLIDFRYQRHFKAERGEHGSGKNMHGKNSEDLIVRIPVGTIIRDADTNQVIGDLTKPGESLTVAKGGRGGRGNHAFATRTNPAPTHAEKGEPGQEGWFILELKLLADVGIIGFPNVGKSTLISRVSAAKPKIANYHFTTITPNLGLVRTPDGRSFVMADIPGLIEGAHEGQGLGHDFLRHTERTKLLVHVLDIAGSEDRDPLEDLKVINNELEKYNPKLASRHQVIAANKMDIEGSQENLQRLRDELPEDSDMFPISAVTGEGIEPLIYKVADLLDQIEDVELIIEGSEKITTVEEGPRFKIEKDQEVFVVTGKEIERHFAMTDFENEDSVRRFQSIIKLMGIEDALRKEGASEGDVVRISELEFDLVD